MATPNVSIETASMTYMESKNVIEFPQQPIIYVIMVLFIIVTCMKVAKLFISKRYKSSVGKMIEQTQALLTIISAQQQAGRA